MTYVGGAGVNPIAISPAPGWGGGAAGVVPVLVGILNAPSRAWMLACRSMAFLAFSTASFEGIGAWGCAGLGKAKGGGGAGAL